MAHQAGDEIVCIARAGTPAEAHIMQNALQEEGIECNVVGDMLDAGIGNVPGLQAELWVHRRDAERAAEILQRHAAGYEMAAEEDEDEDENENT